MTAERKHVAHPTEQMTSFYSSCLSPINSPFKRFHIKTLCLPVASRVVGWGSVGGWGGRGHKRAKTQRASAPLETEEQRLTKQRVVWLIIQLM